MYKSITANLMVESVDETLEFYVGLLEFRVAASVPKKDGKLQFAIVEKDGLTLMFQDRENLVEEYPILSTNITKPSATVYIIVDNFTEVYETLKIKCEIVGELHKTFYGKDEFAIKDNNGYVLTFADWQ